MVECNRGATKCRSIHSVFTSTIKLFGIVYNRAIQAWLKPSSVTLLPHMKSTRVAGAILLETSPLELTRLKNSSWTLRETKVLRRRACFLWLE